MHTNFIKAVHYTRLIKAGGRLREFNFRKIRSAEVETFSIDTPDDRGNRLLFQMQKRGNENWILVPQQRLPRWIPENETRLHDAIEDELQNPS